MKFTFALLAAASAAGCSTSAPEGARLAQQNCSILYHPVLHENVTGELVLGRRSPTSGTEKYCRHVEEDNARYAHRERTQRETNANYPTPLPRT